MRKRKDIEKNFYDEVADIPIKTYSDWASDYILEVLLDIREILIHQYGT